MSLCRINISGTDIESFIRVGEDYFSFSTMIQKGMTEMCTDLRLINSENRRISGRNLDYSGELDTWVSVVPSGTKFTSIDLPANNRSGFSWASKFNYVSFISLPVSIGFVPTDFLFDKLNAEWKAMSNEAMNDQGLSAASLWNNDVGYLPEDKWPPGLPLMADFSVVEWIVGTFKTVSELKDQLNQPLPFIIWGDVEIFGKKITPAPAHYVVHDATGDNIIIEIIDGVITTPDSPAWVITNEPRMSWQVANLSNYANLSYVDPQHPAFGGGAVRPLGCGAGLLGLPGDYTPPSRFSKIAVLNESGRNCPLSHAKQMVSHAFNLLSAVAPLYGLNKTPGGDDFTQWQVVRNHQDGIYYIRTYFGTATQVIKIKEINFNAYKTSRYQRLGDANMEVVFPLPAAPC